MPQISLLCTVVVLEATLSQFLNGRVVGFVAEQFASHFAGYFLATQFPIGW